MLADVKAEISGLSTPERVARTRSVEADIRRLEAELAVLIGELDGDAVHRVDGHASVRGFLRAELRWSEGDITHRLRSARLVDDLPDVMEALWAGDVGVSQVRALGKARANPRCGDQLGDHASILLAHARSLSYEEFALCVRRWEMLADADGAYKDAEANHARRSMSMVEHDGVGHIIGQCGALDLAEIREIWGRFKDAEFTADWEATKAKHGDAACVGLMPRSDTQRGFDAFKQMCIDAASTPADSQRPEPTLNIVMDVNTFERTLAAMGLAPDSDSSPQTLLGDLAIHKWRCETIDGTLVSPVEAVLAALHGHVRRVVFDSAGNVVDLGRRRRLFEGTVREAVLLVAIRCIWPGCFVPVGRCQADHIEDWQHGGCTCSTNGAPLCGRHNRWKNRGYKVWRDPDGIWHTYRPDGTEIGVAA